MAVLHAAPPLAHVDAVFPGVHVAAVPRKGRGLFASDAIPVGSVVLQERALAYASVAGITGAEDEPIIISARLAAEVLIAGLEGATHCLSPQPGSDFRSHPGRTTRLAELRQARQFLSQGPASKSIAMLADGRVDRLVLAISLNAHGLRPPGGVYLQGLFPEMAAMVNHSCCPNMVYQGIWVESSAPSGVELAIVLRAVRDIEAGEELTISYLESLYTSHSERDERLRDLYFFSAEQRTCDETLEALLQLPSEQQHEALGVVVRCNGEADNAWEHALALQAAGETLASSEKLQKLYQEAIRHYDAVLGAGLLAETHVWRYNANRRLAVLLTASGDPEKCAKALTCCESVLRCGDAVWPSPFYPERRAVLRTAVKAASGAGDVALRDQYSTELAQVEEIMGLS